MARRFHRVENAPFLDYSRNLSSRYPGALPCLCTAYFEGESRMGDRVTQSGQGDLARARRLKKALESGTPPAFVPARKRVDGESVPRKLLSRTLARRKHYRQTRLEKSRTRRHSPAISGTDVSGVARWAEHRGCEHRVLWANETFVRMFGYEAAEVAGHSLENLVVPPERLAESRWVTEAVSKGERITLETQRRKKDGSLLDVSVSCAPLVMDGKVDRVLCRIPRHFRSQARGSLEFGALPGGREEQQRP